MLYGEKTVEKPGFLLEAHDANFYFTMTVISWMTESFKFSSWEHLLDFDARDSWKAFLGGNF